MVCQKDITGTVSYTQYCHDECYIRSTPKESLRYWFEGGLILPKHAELAKARLQQDEDLPCPTVVVRSSGY